MQHINLFNTRDNPGKFFMCVDKVAQVDLCVLQQGQKQPLFYCV
jgi:hypothetical protein